jgi:hypothetical protein
MGISRTSVKFGTMLSSSSSAGMLSSSGSFETENEGTVTSQVV